MKKVLIGFLALWSIPSFAMSFGAFAVHCQAQRDVIHDIDRALEAGPSSDTTKEAYFEHIMRSIMGAQHCSDMDGTLRDILRDLPSEKSSDERFAKKWEETKAAVKAQNEYYSRLRNKSAANRFEEAFKNVGNENTR